MATRRQEGIDSSATLAPERSRAKPPPMYKVLLLNDDFTPMDFVIVVLEKFFKLSREQATGIMLKVHREGKGTCGVYPRDMAATKVKQVNAFSRQHQHPLACVMEENP
jgi:ATP-dependent Clp protease adaptor protein ClpS